jgi:alpha-L-fucosidase
MGGPAVTASLQHGDPHGSVWRPGEADVSIRKGWFWHPEQDDAVRSVDNLIELYFSSVGRNANLLLNVPPTTDGLFHETDVARLAEFGRRRDALFAHDLAAGARTRWSAGADGRSGALEVDLASPAAFDVVRLEEAIENGQTIERYRLLASCGGAWREVSSGTTIGHAKLDRIPRVTADRLKLEVSGFDTPSVAALKLFSS